MLDLLFVYGTLRSQFDNRYARLLRSHAQFMGRTTVPGSIFQVRHYPGWRPEPAGVVHGEVYQMRDPEATLKSLDEYEGADFERVVLNGMWIYRYRKSPSEDSRILNGDFCNE